MYGNEVRRRLESLGIAEVLTAPQSPWQNAYVERLIGSVQRECLNHLIVLNARHLKRTLAVYFRYYHASRSHLRLAKQCPLPRQVSSVGRIVKISQLGGLHHVTSALRLSVMPSGRIFGKLREVSSPLILCRDATILAVLRRSVRGLWRCRVFRDPSGILLERADVRTNR
jgi:hypothetical protein